MEKADVGKAWISLPIAHFSGAVLILTCFWTALQFQGLGAVPFHTKGEPREALPVQDLMRGERILLPLRNAYEMPRKPPLFYWLGGAAAAATGELDEGTVRLPSAAQSLAAAVLVLAVATAAGHAMAGLCAALILLTSFEWMRSSVSARIDMTLALGTTASFAGLYLARIRPRRIAPLLLFYGGMVWGTLAKGPVGIVLPTLCLGLVLASEMGTRWILAVFGAAAAAAAAVALNIPKELVAAALALLGAVGAYAAFDRLRPMYPFIGYALVGVVTGAWYAAAALAIGEQFVRTQIVAENFGRFIDAAQADVGHRHGFAYLVGALLAGTLPWALFLPAIAAAARVRRQEEWRRLLVHAAIWVAGVFTFFALSSSKRSVYLLPLYPAASLFAGNWLAGVATGFPPGPLLCAASRIAAAAVALLATTLAALLALGAFGVPLQQALVLPILTAAAGSEVAGSVLAGFDGSQFQLAIRSAALGLAALTVVLAADQRRGHWLVGALLAMVFAANSLAQHGIMPAVAPSASRAAFAERLSATAGARPIVTARRFDYGTAFYLDGNVPVVDLAAEPPAGSLIVIRRDHWQNLRSATRARFEIVPGLRAAKQGNQPALMVVRELTQTPARLDDGAAPAEN